MAESTRVEIPTDAELSEAVVDSETLAPRGEPCDGCGSPVESDDRFCPACGDSRKTVPEEAVEEPQKIFRCKNCGSEVATSQDQRSYVCPFCDSTYVVEFSPQTTDRQRPEFVIGFAVTEQQARQKFRHWIGHGAWYRPGDLHQAQVEEKLRGVYLPFWSFSMLAESRWSARIGEYWYRTETYITTNSKGKTVTRTRRVRMTEWWNLSGDHHQYHRGYLVSGSCGLSQQDADRIKPFNLPALRRYEPRYLAGWLAEEYTIDRSQALESCQQEFYRREQADVAAFLPGDTHRRLNVSTEFSRIHSDLCLLPVYILSYRYRDKVYRFLLNGQTGKTAGDKPISWGRIAMMVGGCGAILLLVVLFWLLMM